MASITICNLPDSVKERLRLQAVRQGLSLEACTRQLFRQASGRNTAVLTGIMEKPAGPKIYHCGIPDIALAPGITSIATVNNKIFPVLPACRSADNNSALLLQHSANRTVYQFNLC